SMAAATTALASRNTRSSRRSISTRSPIPGASILPFAPARAPTTKHARCSPRSISRSGSEGVPHTRNKRSESMAKKSSSEKNNRLRKMAKQYANRRAKLKAIAYDKKLPMEERFAASLKLAALPRNSYKRRIRNRCELRRRPRAYYRKHRLSRIALRELGSKGLIPGLVKSSWEGGRDGSERSDSRQHTAAQ